MAQFPLVVVIWPWSYRPFGEWWTGSTSLFTKKVDVTIWVPIGFAPSVESYPRWNNMIVMISAAKLQWNDQWQHRGREEICPPVRGSAPPLASPPLKFLKKAKISHFRQIFGTFAPTNAFSPLNAPHKNFLVPPLAMIICGIKHQLLILLLLHPPTICLNLVEWSCT